MLSGSSVARTISVSNVRPRPCAASPFRMKPLKLSKVVIAEVPMVASRPPFGASGLT